MPGQNHEVHAVARDLRSIAKHGHFETILSVDPLKGISPSINHQPYARLNPFGRKNEEYDPILEITLDTPSLATELSANRHDPTLTRLLQLARFPFVRVTALPTEQPKIAEVLEQHGVLIAEKQHGSPILVVRGVSEKGPFSMALHETDILVTRDANRKPLEVPRSFWRSCPSETIEIVRLLSLSRGVFEVIPGFSVDDTSYWIYRRWKLFSGLQIPWSTAVYCREKSNRAEGVFEQLKSLWLRQELLCRAADRCCIHALSNQGNENLTQALFHFGYFVMLTTGLFDDLAWLACKFCEITIDRRHVDLRKEEFHIQIGAKNRSLRRYLTEEQNFLKLFYPIRDRLQHRLFIAKCVVGDLRFDRNVLELPADTLNCIDNRPGKDPREDWGVVQLAGRNYVQPDKFVRAALPAIAELHDIYLSKIPWTRLMKSNSLGGTGGDHGPPRAFQDRYLEVFGVG